VLHVEGKFWFGFTPPQSSGAYLARLVSQHAAHAPEHANCRKRILYRTLLIARVAY